MITVAHAKKNRANKTHLTKAGRKHTMEQRRKTLAMIIISCTKILCTWIQLNDVAGI